jgi:hypothetical protein
MRLALDQNFPLPLVRAFEPFIPPSIKLEHLAKIDPALSRVTDDELVRELNRRNYDGLVTTDYHMLDDPETVAAMVDTKLTVLVIEAAGHDPLKATAALFQELPGLEHRLLSNQANVILHRPRSTKPKPAWEYLKRIADKQDADVSDLWKRHKR